MGVRKNVEPLIQGNLDALCAAYSICNAIRICLDGARVHRDFHWDLLNQFIQYADEHGKAAQFVTKGLTILDMTELLQLTATFVASHTKWELTLRRPFIGKHLTQAAYFQRLAEHLSDRRRACILAMGHPEFPYHWTAVQSVTGRHLRLVDSCDYGKVWRSALRIARPGQPRGYNHWIPSATYLLALS